MGQRGRRSRISVKRWPIGLVAIFLVACSGGTATPATKTPVPVGGTTPAAVTAGPGATTAAPPPVGGGSTGKPATTTADLTNILGPGDFAAVGISGAGAPTNNPTDNAAYIVYKGKSAASGGLELDAFWFDTAAEAAASFGSSGVYALDPADTAALGADDAWISLSELGNDPGTTFAELRVLKGRIWFDLGIPSGDQAQAQLLALATIVLSRAGSLI